MSYGTPRAVLSDGAIRCLPCAIKRFTSYQREDIDSEIVTHFTNMIDCENMGTCARNFAFITYDESLAIVREGQDQAFLYGQTCEDCSIDLESLCEDYGNGSDTSTLNASILDDTYQYVRFTDTERELLQAMKAKYVQSEHMPLEELRRLEFTRYLVDTGKLTEEC